MTRSFSVLLAAWLLGQATAFLPQRSAPRAFSRSLQRAVSRSFDGGDNDSRRRHYPRHRREGGPRQRREGGNGDDGSDGGTRGSHRAATHFYVVEFPERRGVHTVQRRRAAANVLLAFESFWGCRRFAALLAAQGFLHATVRPMNTLQLAALAERIDVDLETVPRHVRLVPPAQTVPELGRNPRRESHALEARLVYMQEEGLIEDQAGSWE